MTRERTYLLALVLLVSAGLIVYSQTFAFAWDEGFHLLAAQLILRGMRPYLDFFHAQTPLYAYWNAFWMRLFGDTWRTAHLVSSVCTTLAVWLTGSYVLDRFNGGIWRKNWRVPLAMAAVLLTGLNSQIVEFGTIGQAYGLCLLAIVGAFRFTVANVKRDDAFFALGAGFCAGAAAASSLLTAPMGPVLFIWMLLAPGARLKRALAFLIGSLIPFLPLIRLFLKNPKVVFFGAVKFHLFYRTVDWSESGKQNLEVATNWLESPHAMVMGLLVLLGLIFLARNDIPVALRGELHLCLWLCVVEGAYLLYVRPTFDRYYLFIVPFVAIISTIGLYYAGTHIGRPEKPRWTMGLLFVILSLAIGKTVYGSKSDYRWKDWEKIAAKVNEVTRPDGLIYADEAVFFITKRQPPSGMEYADTHKLHLSNELEAQLHIFPKEELLKRVKGEVYDTVATCEDDDKMTEQNLPTNYKQKITIGDCAVFWDKDKATR
ncbi:MAG TPA: hypothetical protein VK752_07050 [Bryobacteraceae bacterium]|nr:hypothetical protein [Bryobacteraceae bacterium]